MATECWKGKREHLEEVYGWNSPEWLETFTEEGEGNGTCLLPDGHDGEHEFTPDNKVMIEFPSAGRGR